MDNFFNTTSETNPDLDEYINQAVSQQEVILAIFRKYHLIEFTPEYINEVYFENTPLTSIRRAFSNLYNAGFIVKTSKTKGIYGRNVYKWRLNCEK